MWTGRDTIRNSLFFAQRYSRRTRNTGHLHVGHAVDTGSRSGRHSHLNSYSHLLQRTTRMQHTHTFRVDATLNANSHRATHSKAQGNMEQLEVKWEHMEFDQVQRRRGSVGRIDSKVSPRGGLAAGDCEENLDFLQSVDLQILGS